MNIEPDCLRSQIWNEFVAFHNKMVICPCEGATAVVPWCGGDRSCKERATTVSRTASINQAKSRRRTAVAFDLSNIRIWQSFFDKVLGYFSENISHQAIFPFASNNRR